MSRPEMLIDRCPNSGPPLKEVWAFVSRDKEGNENVLGHFSAIGWQPMLTGNPETFAKMRETVRGMKQKVESAGEQTLHLLHFTNREELPFP